MRRLILFGVLWALLFGCGPSEAPTTSSDSTQVSEVAPQSLPLASPLDRPEVVERLVQYRYTDQGIRRTDRAPIWFELGGGTGRNWEGLAHFRDGFLVATDRFPPHHPGRRSGPQATRDTPVTIFCQRQTATVSASCDGPCQSVDAPERNTVLTM